MKLATLGSGEVVENGFTLGTKFIPHDGDVAGALDLLLPTLKLG